MKILDVSICSVIECALVFTFLFFEGNVSRDVSRNVSRIASDDEIHQLIAFLIT